MNLKALAARFVELHPQYKYDLTNHVWVIADPSVEGGYLYPTSDRLIGDEVQTLTVAMVDGNNADMRAKRGRPFQYLHGEFVKPLLVACRVRLPERHIPWDDFDQLEKLPGRKAHVASYRGRMSGLWSIWRRTPWASVTVMLDSHSKSEWLASTHNDALKDIYPRGWIIAGSVCRLDALRRLLDSAPWLRKGLAGPDAAVSHPSN
jgi:hypothetical protein